MSGSYASMALKVGGVCRSTDRSIRLCRPDEQAKRPRAFSLATTFCTTASSRASSHASRASGHDRDRGRETRGTMGIDLNRERILRTNRQVGELRLLNRPAHASLRRGPSKRGGSIRNPPEDRKPYMLLYVGKNFLCPVA